MSGTAPDVAAFPKKKTDPPQIADMDRFGPPLAGTSIPTNRKTCYSTPRTVFSFQ